MYEEKRRIKIKHGYKRDMPESLLLAELAYTDDEGCLYVGTGTGIHYVAGRSPVYLESVAEMKANKYLKQGTLCTTMGYYVRNDGGMATYVIEPSDLADNGGTVIALNNGLKALMVIPHSGVVNIRQFGAKGDETQCDADCIQRCFDSNMTVKVPNGRYKLTKTLAVKQDQLHIIGENGRDTVFNYVGSAGTVMTISSKTTIKIQDIDFVSTNNTVVGLELTDVNKTIIQDCTFRKYSRAIKINDTCKDLFLYRNHFVENTESISHVLGTIVNLTVDNCTFTRPTRGIMIDQSRSVKIQDCVFDVCGKAIVKQNKGDISITGCYFNLNTDNDIEVKKATTSPGTIKVDSCAFDKNVNKNCLNLTSLDAGVVLVMISSFIYTAPPTGTTYYAIGTTTTPSGSVTNLGCLTENCTLSDANTTMNVQSMTRIIRS